MEMLKKILGIRSDFEQIFFRNEYAALSGQNRRTIFALLSILFFTFLALGFAAGSLKNLKRKMDNPFTNWVDVEVRNSQIAGQLSKIQERYTQDSVTGPLQLQSCTGWVKFYQDFYARTYDPLRFDADTLRFQLPGRTVDSEEPLLAKILDPKSNNLVWHAKDFDLADPASMEDCSVIITQSMMERLGYKDPSEIGYLCSRDVDPLFIKVVAVVNELPNFCNFICLPKLYNILKAKRDGSKKCQDLITGNQSGSNIFIFLTSADVDIARLDSLGSVFFPDRTLSFAQESTLSSGPHNWQTCSLAFLPVETPPTDSVTRFLDWAKQSAPITAYSTLDCGAGICGSMDPGDYHYLAFNFNRLDKIRQFRADMLEHFAVDVDMSQVEAKENFALVTGLTIAISFILLSFGILSIVLFVDNLLRTHLFEVRSNIGTFQAFGLNNRFLINIYLKIILAFLVLSIFVALLLTVVIDFIEQSIMGDESRFDIFSISILVATVGLLVVSLFRSGHTIRRILGDTPGNLIYER